MQHSNISVTTTVFIRLSDPVCEDISLLETLSDVAVMCFMKRVHRHHETRFKSTSERARMQKNKSQCELRWQPCQIQVLLNNRRPRSFMQSGVLEFNENKMKRKKKKKAVSVYK